MPLLINNLKLKAAVGSMHQFCPVVRTIFPVPPSEDVVEAATVFLYTHLAETIFGGRFAAKLRERVRGRAKFASPVDIETRVCRIHRHLDEFAVHAAAGDRTRSPHEAFTDHVHSVIRALIAEAGLPDDDPELVRDAFPRFESAARRVRDHLMGIKRQSRFMMS